MKFKTEFVKYVIRELARGFNNYDDKSKESLVENETSFGLSVGWMAGLSVIISWTGWKLNYHAPIGALAIKRFDHISIYNF